MREKTLIETIERELENIEKKVSILRNLINEMKVDWDGN